MENSLPIEITEKAWEEIIHIVEKKNIPADYGLRIGINGAGCAGISYMLGFDKPNDNDKTYSINNLDVYIQKKDMMYLIGIKLDFYEGNDAQGFTFVKD